MELSATVHVFRCFPGGDRNSTEKRDAKKSTVHRMYVCGVVPRGRPRHKIHPVDGWTLGVRQHERRHIACKKAFEK
ncbi:hypothetical protein J6590_089464 [Homalodisca vitripennis]|nr:hypothetical protein J6590_089464 [Homalodisca vitripennis]